MPAGHMDVEDYVTLMFPLTYVIIGHADRQRSLLAIIYRRIAEEDVKMRLIYQIFKYSNIQIFLYIISIYILYS